MNSYRVEELAEIISADIIGNPTGLVEEVYFDSRNLFQPINGVFFAFDEFQQNGSKYISDAYEKGIRVFVTSKVEDTEMDAVYLKVDSPLKALQEWGRYHRTQFRLKVIAITGSNGKTIVKEWLNQLLWEDFSIVRSPKSYNSQIGVPLSVLRITAERNLGLFEAGISLPNEMQSLEEIIQPKIGVLTHIGSAHLENFSSKEELIKEKLKLFKNVESIVFNADDELVRDLILKELSDRKLFGFGNGNENVIQLKSISNTDLGRTINITFENENLDFTIPFKDSASIENVLTTLTTIAALDLDVRKYLPKTSNLLPVEMRLEIKEAIRDSILINDTFNSDLHSVKVALDVLAQQPFPHKSLVLTDILQSNLEPDKLYRKVADLVNNYPINDLILIGDTLPKYRDWFKADARTFRTTDAFFKTLSVQNVNNEAILLKGSRPFQLEKISAFLEKKSHDTVLEINLQALIDNIKVFKNKLKPKTKMMAMIKANSYGTGSFEIAQTLEHHKIDYLGAAYADEGVELRKAGINLPILVMNPEQSSYGPIIDFKLEPEIYSLRVLKMFIKKLKEKSFTNPYPIHIKFDSGMNRLGFRIEELQELLEFLKEEKSVRIRSIFTHLATADLPSERKFALEQLEKFDKAYEYIANELSIRPIKHALNSSGITHFPEHQYDMVRIGIGMYGISDDKETQKQLKHVSTFKTLISQISTIEKGESVSYGRNFKAEKTTRIATIPVGYADGIRRAFGNGVGKMRVNGHLVPVVGTICMDMMMLDVTEIDCEEGDEVIIFGKNLSIVELAKQIDTIPYEILTSISSRVKRIYYRE